jgi:hypothetical protein
MNPNDTTAREIVTIDERFMGDWVGFGMSELESYLSKHLRFAAYCDARDAHTETD